MNSEAWTNDVIQACNELYGGGAMAADALTSSAQHLAVEQIHEVIRRQGPPVCSTAEAVSELCGQRPGYDCPGPCAPFSKDLLSLPDCGGLVDGDRCLDGQALHSWREWKQEIWLPPSARIDARPVKPYSDPALVQRPQVYAEFIARLVRSGMCTIGPARDPLVGIFFVKKRIQDFV